MCRLLGRVPASSGDAARPCARRAPAAATACRYWPAYVCSSVRVSVARLPPDVEGMPQDVPPILRLLNALEQLHAHSSSARCRTSRPYRSLTRAKRKPMLTVSDGLRNCTRRASRPHAPCRARAAARRPAVRRRRCRPPAGQPAGRLAAPAGAEGGRARLRPAGRDAEALPRGARRHRGAARLPGRVLGSRAGSIQASSRAGGGTDVEHHRTPSRPQVDHREGDARARIRRLHGRDRHLVAARAGTRSAARTSSAWCSSRAPAAASTRSARTAARASGPTCSRSKGLRRSRSRGARTRSRAHSRRPSSRCASSPTATGPGVELEHRGWERLGDEAAKSRKNYDGGWEHVLGRFVAAFT